MTKWIKADRDLMHSAGRPASDEEMQRAFLEANGLTEWAYFSHGGDDLAYILQHGRFPRGHRRRPANGYPWHPYMPPDEIRDEVEAWGLEHGLTAKVCDSAKSWYYPGGTALVVITAPGVKVVI